MRGCLYHHIGTHSLNSDKYVSSLEDNVMTNMMDTSYYIVIQNSMKTEDYINHKKMKLERR